MNEYYSETYEMLLNRQYTEAASRAKQGKTKYNSKNYNSKFAVLEASALAGAGSYDLADSLITDFIRSNPGDTLIAWAESVKQYIQQNKPKPIPSPTLSSTGSLNNDSLNTAGATATALTSDPLLNKTAANTTNPAPAPVEVPSSYTYAPGEQHFFLFVQRNGR